MHWKWLPKTHSGLPLIYIHFGVNAWSPNFDDKRKKEKELRAWASLTTRRGLWGEGHGLVLGQNGRRQNRGSRWWWLDATLVMEGARKLYIASSQCLNLYCINDKFYVKDHLLKVHQNFKSLMQSTEIWYSATKNKTHGWPPRSTTHLYPAVVPPC